MSNNVTMAAPIDYTNNNSIAYRCCNPFVDASVAFTLASPPSPAPSLKRRRAFEHRYECSNSDCEADDEEGSSESDSDSDSDLSDLEDEEKENVAPPRKRLCIALQGYPRLRMAELSAISGRSSRASWTSASTCTLLTPPDSPRFVFRPLELIKVEDEDEEQDDVDFKGSALFASDIEGPPTSSDESGASVASVDHGNDDIHYTDSEVELKATTQNPLSFSSTEEEEESGEEESGEEEGYGLEEEEYGDVEDEYENRGVDEEDDYEGEDEDENNEGYYEHNGYAAVRADSYPQYAGMSGAAIFARQCVAELSAGGIVASSEVLYGITNAQYIDFEEEL